MGPSSASAARSKRCHLPCGLLFRSTRPSVRIRRYSRLRSPSLSTMSAACVVLPPPMAPTSLGQARTASRSASTNPCPPGGLELTARYRPRAGVFAGSACSITCQDPPRAAPIEDPMFRPNSLKAKLRAGHPAVGCWSVLGAAAPVEVLAGAGFDALLIDQEHGEGTLSDGVGQLRAAAYDVTMLIRVPSHDPAYIKRVLDAGFEGVMVPGVETADQARSIVDACRYPPLGRRGAGGTSRAVDYGRRWKEYQARHGSELMIIVQIESAAAVEQIPAIAKVEGLDMLFIGPLDLSASIGKTGQFGDPAFQELQSRAERAIKTTGKWLGGIDLEGRARDLLKRGYDIVFATSDMQLLRDGAAAVLAQVRA
ncbi:MAG: hypothetical protein EXQ85_00705 [Alphaproteobacteria bacterium]|nr:hypothetical protein [Alphaproteobacteria bacterium]